MMSPSKKMGIEEQDYDDDVCHANEVFWKGKGI